MSAAVIAAARELNITLELSLLQKILIEIEPSDATFLKGINLFDHVQGQKSQYLGEIKEIPLLIYDYGGKVDTLAFNQREDLSKLNRDKEKEIEKAYNFITKGIEQYNLELIGKGATISSLANQAILPKRGLKELIQILEKQPGYLGINTAHSGTVIGIMLKEESMFSSIIELLNEKTPKLKLLYKTKIINGGYQIIKEEG
jgi:L-threonine kinase